MNELSIFIDESGDFGYAEKLPAYYLVTLVFHDQSEDISNQMQLFDRRVSEIDPAIKYVHSGPLVRREDRFKDYSLDERRRLLYCMLNFYNQCPITHSTIVVYRKENRDKVSLAGSLSRNLSAELKNHLEYINSFEKVIVYYDYGQSELGALLNASLSSFLSSVEFRNANPRIYKLLQVADFINYIELLKIKSSSKTLSNSETKFFYRSQELKKTFIRSIDKKRL